MGSSLSPYRLKKAREIYNTFNILNAVSWNLLVGVIITLFALRLGASSTYIGFLSSTFYIALFMLPLGKILARRFSIIGINCVTWIIRSLCMILAVIAPFFDYAGHRNIALFLILAGVFLFNIFRGVGMIANNPVLGLLASGPDRGSYLTQIQVIGGAIGMVGSFVMAMILGFEPPVFIFSILLSAGIITGVISGYIIKKVPEPPGENDVQRMSMFGIFKEAFSQDYIRHFMFILFIVILSSGVSRTFIVVYAREVFKHNDGLVSLYSVFGGLGYLIAGLSVKFLVDKLGAKPLFLVSVIIGLFSILPIIFLPSSEISNMSAAILFLAFVFFMINFGFLGSEGIAQTYYLALVPPEKMLDLGILYFFIVGAAGAIGSFLAGVLLDILSALGVSYNVSFKILFSILAALIIIVLAFQKKMKPLESLPLKDALEVIFSVRDLRAISLVDKLNKTQNAGEEEMILGALHETPSQISIKSLLERMRSPRLAARQESLGALEKLSSLNEDAQKALIEDMVNNQFTTAYISARILGKRGCAAAIPLLRELASSTDYMLAGEAIIALANMKDKEFRPEIEKIILDTGNPRLKIMGAQALGMFHCIDSLPILFDIMGTEDISVYLRNEAALAAASILDIHAQYYSILARFTADNSLAAALGLDEADAAYEHCKTFITGKKKEKMERNIAFNNLLDTLQISVKSYIENKDGRELSIWILGIPGEICKGGNTVKKLLAGAVNESKLAEYDCVRLLFIQWAAVELRSIAGFYG